MSKVYSLYVRAEITETLFSLGVSASQKAIFLIRPCSNAKELIHL